MVFHKQTLNFLNPQQVTSTSSHPLHLPILPVINTITVVMNLVHLLMVFLRPSQLHSCLRGAGQQVSLSTDSAPHYGGTFGVSPLWSVNAHHLSLFSGQCGYLADLNDPRHVGLLAEATPEL